MEKKLANLSCGDGQIFGLPVDGSYVYDFFFGKPLGGGFAHCFAVHFLNDRIFST